MLFWLPSSQVYPALRMEFPQRVARHLAVAAVVTVVAGEGQRQWEPL